MPYIITSALKGVRALSDTDHGAAYYNALFGTTDCVILWEAPPTAEAIEAQRLLALKKTTCSLCENFMSEKFAAGFIYGGVTYQIDKESQENIDKRAIYAGWSNQDSVTFPWGTPYSRGWVDTNNIWHAMTAMEFMLFGKAVSDYVSSCYACCRDHKSAITTVNCETYNYTTGWPVNP